MKPILKNFSGSGVLEYQIRYELKENIVCLNLYIRTPFNTKWEFHDNAIGLYDSETQSSTKGLEEALSNAQEKWGLKLLKADLEQVA